MKKAFTLIELLVVIAIIAILAAILFPVFAQAKAAAKKTQDISNTKQTGLAAIMYAGDFDDVLPRHDNNGSCLYGASPCNTPDWGDFRFPTGGNAQTGAAVMYWGAIEPYHKNTQISINPAMGETRWQGAFAAAASLGITPPAGGYLKADEKYYYNTLGQMALNMLLIDYGPTSTTGLNGRPGAVKGNMTAVARPADIFLAVGSSSWDWHAGLTNNLGNGAVWPSWPLNTQCWSYNVEGWTRYIHNGKTAAHAEYDPNRATANPNMQGIAAFVYVDGHCKPLKYTQAERCDATPAGVTWAVNSSTNAAYYYPNWVPEL